MQIPLSALQHYAFCPRQCALIHNEMQWAENYLTAQGRVLHERVDTGEPETRKGIRYERTVRIASEQYGITGILDLVEKDLATGALKPIEYKHGKPKPTDEDNIQLCAQVLCLEEMTGQTIPEAAFWYGKIHHRHPLLITKELREKTIHTIQTVRELLESGKTPLPQYRKHCKACSLHEICQPQLIEADYSPHYIAALYQVENNDA